MYKLTDLLALGAALHRLDGSMNVGTLNSLMDRGSNQPACSIEGLFDALRRALEGPNITPSAIGDAEDSAPSRVGLHAALDKFNKNHQDLAGQLTIEASSPDLQSQARYDFAALVALQDLSPIAVRGVPASLWQSTRAANDLLDGGTGSEGNAIYSGATNVYWISASGQFSSIKTAQNDERWICAA